MVLCSGMLMIILDQTIVNVALPSMQRDLGFSQSNLAWVVNAYMIGFGGLLLLAGRAGDLLGRKRVFLSGLAVFTLASILCGVATSQETLIAARFVQGIGGAMTAAVILGMIVTLYPDPAGQTRAIAVYSFVAAAGGALGLLLGGILTEALSWHWIFFVNLPIGIAAGLMALRVLKTEEGLGLEAGADVLGALLITSGLMLGVYTIVEVTERGWGSLHTVGLGGISLLLLAAFVRRQATIDQPLLNLRIFRSRQVTGANILQGLMVSSFAGTFFLGALHLQRVVGYGPVEVGLAFLPVAVVLGAFSLFVSAFLITRFGAARVLLPGLGLVFAGLLLWTQVPAEANYLSDLAPAMVLLGVGAGLAFPALMTLAMSGATTEDSGLASGLANTTQQVGGALGLAVLATLATSRTDAMLEDGAAIATALTSGYHVAFWVASGLIAAAIGLTVLMFRE